MDRSRNRPRKSPALAEGWGRWGARKMVPVTVFRKRTGLSLNTPMAGGLLENRSIGRGGARVHHL